MGINYDEMTSVELFETYQSYNVKYTDTKGHQVETLVELVRFEGYSGDDFEVTHIVIDKEEGNLSFEEKQELIEFVKHFIERQTVVEEEKGGE